MQRWAISVICDDTSACNHCGTSPLLCLPTNLASSGFLRSWDDSPTPPLRCRRMGEGIPDLTPCKPRLLAKIVNLLLAVVRPSQMSSAFVDGCPRTQWVKYTYPVCLHLLPAREKDGQSQGGHALFPRMCHDGTAVFNVIRTLHIDVHLFDSHKLNGVRACLWSSI